MSAAPSAYVVVENAASDGAWLRALCGAFGREALGAALDDGTLRLTSAGGCDNLWPTARKLLRREARVVAIRDSDALHPWHEPAPLRALRERAEDEGARSNLIILRRREAENYLTTACLTHLTPCPAAAIEALERLSRDQRAYFDMKSGFDAERGALAREPAVIRAARARLYEDVSQDDRAALRAGFTRQVGTLLTSEAARAAYTRAAVRAELGEEAEAELEALLDALEALRTCP